MTTPPTPQPWDDDRLDAAFAVHVTAGPTPDDLTERTIASVRRAPAGRSLRWRYMVPTMAAIAVAALVVLGVAGLGAPSSRTRDAPATSLPSSTPSSSEATTVTMGLPVLNVAGAIAIRDAGADDHELAVRGWYGAHAPPRACGRQTFPESVSPLQVRCPDQLLWLMQDREQLTTITGTSTSYRGPTGPAISPHFDDVDMAWSSPGDDPFRPVELVVIGHFDDAGAARCPAAEQATCRDRFVVDRIDSIDGVQQPFSVVDRVDGAELSTLDDIHAAVDRWSPDRPILSMVIVDAEVEGLRDGPSPTVWVARVLGLRFLEHHVVFDGTEEVFTVRTSGPPKFAVPLPGEPVDEVLGIPVISVPELIALRTGGPPPTAEEVAVQGWLLGSTVVYDCLVDPDPHPLALRCQTPVFLMERPERARDYTTEGPSVVPVMGPDAPIEIAIPRMDPIEVIAIGHLGDHRWQTCRLAEQDACRRQFVVDRIVAADASVVEPPNPWHIPASTPSEPVLEAQDVISRVEAVLGDLTVISLGHVAAGRLEDIEPAVADRGTGDALRQVWPVWVVRAFVPTGPDAAVARTFVVPDVDADAAVTTIWERTENGVAPVLEAGGAPEWPPEGATIVEQLGMDRHDPIAVMDETGRLVGARVPTAAETATRDLGMRMVWADDLPDDRVLVQWGGSMCDDRLTLTISAFDAGTPFTLTVDGRRGSPCRLALVYYAVVLEFEPAIGAADLGGRYLIGP